MRTIETALVRQPDPEVVLRVLSRAERAYLPTRDHWIKGAFRRQVCAGQRLIVGRCLGGALIDATRDAILGDERVASGLIDAVQDPVHAAVVMRGYQSIPTFNDHVRVGYDDVKDVLAQARGIVQARAERLRSREVMHK